MADNQSRVEFLRTALKGQINSFRTRRSTNRRMAFFGKMAVSTLGAATTIIIGLQSNRLFELYGFAHASDWLSALALLTSASVTLFSVWEGFFDHRWLWIRYTATLGQLYAIAAEVEYLTAGGSDVAADRLDSLFARMQTVLQDTNTAWSEKRAKDVKEDAPSRR